MSILDHLASARCHQPKAVALFVRRAAAQLGDQAEDLDPFFLAGRLDRVFGENSAAVALFRACSDVGTSRERRKTGWQL